VYTETTTTTTKNRSLLGRIKLFKKAIRDTDRGAGAIFKIEVLRNGISGILRLSASYYVSFLIQGARPKPPPHPSTVKYRRKSKRLRVGIKISLETGTLWK